MFIRITALLGVYPQEWGRQISRYKTVAGVSGALRHDFQKRQMLRPDDRLVGQDYCSQYVSFTRLTESRENDKAIIYSSHFIMHQFDSSLFSQSIQ